MTTISTSAGDVNVGVRNGVAAISPAPMQTQQLIDNYGTVVFDVSELAIASATLPSHVIRSFAAEEVGIEIVLPQGAIILSPEAVAYLSTTAHTSLITFRITVVPEKQIPRLVASNMPVGATLFQVSISARSRSIRDFGYADLVIRLPFESEPPVCVFRVGNGGRLMPLRDISFVDNYAMFTTNEIGLFVVDC